LAKSYMAQPKTSLRLTPEFSMAMGPVLGEELI